MKGSQEELVKFSMSNQGLCKTIQGSLKELTKYSMIAQGINKIIKDH